MRDSRGGGFAYYGVVFALEMVFGLIASIIVAWFSRYREFRADAGGAELSESRKMILALESLQKTYGQSELPKEMAAFGISGGLGQGLAKLFASHPPLEQRIAALREARG
jgi:heat shock protein HtpX